ncbi:GNAT family N-acetyltransferase [Pseudonocardia endophytica]|uniref:Uncharacterized protein (DUF952 family) n=1 Tax=Pseudonocardia endophytica TaxID=401976 RepID=A0A4R1HDH2_PSEEN|nr:GNAT family N-acetyltransferase [Pseudonocardia endophytica]TCK20107.1 uncharacterized protein (DUF952 family) [Pseudonocardia endophytica]
MTDVLLHLCSPPEWRAALEAGVVAPPSLTDVGFVHLSTADQVALPAERLFAGRRDMVLLAVDPGRLERAGIEVRWEPGVPGDPESMRFPHAYGAIPATAVLGVLPYRPDDDGRFSAPEVPPLDDAGRGRLLQPSILRRTATREVGIAGGVAVLTDSVPSSMLHNQLLVGPGVDTATLVAEADRVLGGAGLTHAAAYVLAPAPGDADALRADGWRIEDLVTMCAPVADLPDATGTELVETVDLDELRPLFDASWRERVPGITDDQAAHLTDRYRIEDAVVALHCYAVREGDRVVATCLLKRDGGTAWLDAVETVPDARRRGHANALIRAAAATARDAGCDLVALDTWADDWKRAWYARLGFTDAGHALAAVRD